MHVTMHQLFRLSVTSYLIFVQLLPEMTLAYSMREKNMLPVVLVLSDVQVDFT